MASPGRVVQRGGKSVYEPLKGMEEDEDFGDVDPTRASVNHCPSERVIWPEYDAGCFSRMFFTWFNPIVQLGAKVPLEMSDLWTLHAKESSAKNVPEFMALWDDEVERARAAGVKPGLMRPVWYHSWRIVVPSGVLLLCGCMFQFIRPLLMMQILLIVEGDPSAIVPREQGWILAFAIGFCALCDFLSFSHYNMFVMKSAWRLRQALVGILFSKVCKLSQGTKASYSQGKITNMMSSDVDRLRMSVRRVNDLWLIPMRFCLALYFVVAILGVVPALSGLGVMIVLIPITKKFVKKLRKYQKEILKYTDKRVKITQEVMSGIRIIKLMAWEKSFYDKIEVVRNEEIQKIRVQAIYRALYFSLSMSVPIITVTLTLAVYTVVEGHRLTASTAFPALSLLNTLREPLQALPEVLMALLVEGRVSLDRMNAFMNEEDIDLYVQKGEPVQQDERCMDIRGGTFRWAPGHKSVWDANDRYAQRPGYAAIITDALPMICGCKQGTDIELEEVDIPEGQDRGPILHDIDFELHHGRLLCVIGQVGCGKTSLMHAIMGEVDKVSGSVSVNGKLAYAAQGPFVMNMTLRDNILFGSEYDAEKYRKVLDACALTSDLDQLPAGDMTQIGERGINLSGGQKQRVGLARAVYKDADIYILDDPLSAVDAHTGQHIMDHVIMGMLKGKTIVLPCHALSFLSHADWIISLAKGRIIEQGTYRGLLEAGGDFTNLMEEHASVKTPRAGDEVEAGSAEEEQPSQQKDEENVSKQTSDESAKGGQGKDGKLMEVEERAKGTVERSVFAYYIKQVGRQLVLMVFCLYIGGSLIRVFRDWWLSRWASYDLSVVLGYDEETWSEFDVTQYFIIFHAASGVAILAFTSTRTIIIQIIGLNASRKLHQNMLWRLLMAPVTFFDQTPVGRIVNRFTSDFQTIDREISFNFVGVARSVLDLISAFAVILWVLPAFLVWMAPMLWFYYKTQKVYRKTAREMKRLSSTARSPIFQHFNETINGLITMRAFDETKRFQDKCGDNVNFFTRTIMCQATIGRWLSVRLQGLGAVTLFWTALAVTLFPDALDAGLAGLAMNYSMQATGTLQGFISSFTELELKMNGIERVKYYSDIATEKPYEKDEKAKLDEPARKIEVAPRRWPARGVIEFRNVCARYRKELDLVLDNVSFDVSSGQKVGVCGRTGSGKSSLMLTLFRVLELDSGSILIDDIDISKLGLSQLRKAIAMLPQDPTLFSGTIRENLDPFQEHSDDKLWDALDKAQLKEAIQDMPDNIGTEVGDGGDMLSVGQRQLLCLARAVLRDSKVLVMDECTASVDVRTDAKIQEMIREVFDGCTVFAIAHRLGTIIDYDRICVLEQGKQVEFGSPKDLLARGHDGPFSKLIDRTGPEVSAHLRAVARGEANMDLESVLSLKEEAD